MFATPPSALQVGFLSCSEPNCTMRLEIRRVEESLLHKFAELDDRLIRLENRRGN